jgi:carbonic anhydrase
MDADEALDRLKEGNNRFRAGLQESNNSIDEATRDIHLEGQSPFATILTCADSRVTPEFIFDQGIASLFVIRTAGAIATSSQIASMEFSIAQLQCPLIVVLGHTRCGAVNATLQHRSGTSPSSQHLQSMVEHISSLLGEGQYSLDDAVHLSAQQTARVLTEQSNVILSAVQSGRVKIVSAMYDFSTGQVIFS